jgi:hypothetical protein
VGGQDLVARRTHLGLLPAVALIPGRPATARTYPIGRAALRHACGLTVYGHGKAVGTAAGTQLDVRVPPGQVAALDAMQQRAEMHRGRRDVIGGRSTLTP